MSADITQAREAINRCRGLRDGGVVEAVLRGEFQSRLRRIFPETADESWINHYGEGAEAHAKVGTASGKAADRFIDNLVGYTSIEYEADLRITAKRNEGLRQVRDHAAGLIRKGVPASQVRGILSDTVEWYAYDAALDPAVDPASCRAEDIVLTLAEELVLPDDEIPSAERLVQFLRRHLAREQSRPLLAHYLSLDLGLESNAYKRSASDLVSIVEKGRQVDPSIELATALWSRFVDYLEGEGSAFRVEAYVDELYMGVLARLLSANVLAEAGISSDEAELCAILDGTYFRGRYQLDNLVEQDYFGWLVTPAHIAGLVPIARAIQHDLYAYDYRWRPEEDLFGRLMAQLARRSQRKLLGQEWTPAWLSRQIAERCLDNLPEGETPRLVDMCCGSGAIMAETLKATKGRFGFADMAALREVVTGFDIDPLAVVLAKTTWVTTLAAEIKAATAPIVIPVYHADSLFAVTPVSASVPLVGESETIDITLDGTTIKLPAALVQPDYRELFDRIVDWAYDGARDAQEHGAEPALSLDDARSFITGAAAACGTVLPADLAEKLAAAVYGLAVRMAALAVAGRNGIWAFILRNTYRPGLLTGQFNGLLSNPPWLAMSALADNPYREVLTSRARLYGIRPAGQSFLHLELGTTHLLHAVDRYLAPEASIVCLVPGSIFNGHHHERFRQRSFLTSQRPVALEITEAWQVEPGTFKYPGAAIIGKKRASSEDVSPVALEGFTARESGLEKVDFSVRSLGSERTAWLLEKGGMPAGATGAEEVSQQGADLMPRTAVCIEILGEGGAEYQVTTPGDGTPWAFTVKATKELKGDRFPGYAAPRFIYRMAQSENLLPFVLGEHCAPIALPAVRIEDESWKMLTPAEIRNLGFTQTARRFQAINTKLAAVGKGTTLQDRIDVRRKLSKQVFGSEGYLVLSGAGGTYICAACLPVSEAADLLIDQTLYWQVTSQEDEAWFRVALLNSRAMTQAILPFNPSGDFGPRHVHTLPYRLMPPFDASNEDHTALASQARDVAATARSIIAKDAYLRDPLRGLHIRRSKLRDALAATKAMSELELNCAAILGTGGGASTETETEQEN